MNKEDLSLLSYIKRVASVKLLTLLFHMIQDLAPKKVKWLKKYQDDGARQVEANPQIPEVCAWSYWQCVLGQCHAVFD